MKAAAKEQMVADASSELLYDVFGGDKNPCHLCMALQAFRLAPVELEVIFEVSA